MKGKLQKISPRDAYAISILAQASKENRKELLKLLSKNMSKKAIKLALKQIKIKI